MSLRDKRKEKQKMNITSLRCEVTISVDHKRRELQKGDQRLKFLVL